MHSIGLSRPVALRQVGAAVVRALAAEPSGAEVVMVNRRAVSQTTDPRVRAVILDTAAAQFPAEMTELAQSMVAQGDLVDGASRVGGGVTPARQTEPNGNRLLTKLDYLEGGAFRARVLACGQPVM